MIGAVFAALFFIVQWPFATFLMSPGARNAFFGAIYFDYNMPPQTFYRRYLFLPHETGAGALATGACIVDRDRDRRQLAGLAMGQLDAPDSSVTMRPRKIILAALAGVVGFGVLGARDAQAHLNSPDLFHEGAAGPYKVLVTIRPPDVIPGVATIEVLASSPDLDQGDAGADADTWPGRDLAAGRRRRRARPERRAPLPGKALVDGDRILAGARARRGPARRRRSRGAGRGAGDAHQDHAGGAGRGAARAAGVSVRRHGQHHRRQRARRRPGRGDRPRSTPPPKRAHRAGSDRAGAGGGDRAADCRGGATRRRSTAAWSTSRSRSPRS